MAMKMSRRAINELETANHQALLRKQLYRKDSLLNTKERTYTSITSEGTYATTKVGSRYSTRKVSDRKVW